MKIDDSFKKPGAVPFKWEIRPGVPKLQDSPRTPQHKSHSVQQELSPFNSPRLKPPPAGFHFHPQQEPRSQSFRSAPNTPSRRFRVLSGPETVSSVGCFLSPMLKRKLAKKGKNRKDHGLEPEYSSDVETSSRWSVSSRRSISPLPHSFHSERMSSPHPVSDAEWSALSLF